jgi:hypothetical protein
VTLLARLDQGFYLMLSVLAFALARRLAFDREPAARPGPILCDWALGAAAPLAVLAVLWLVTGAIPSMVQQLVVFPLTTYVKTSSLPFPRFGADLLAPQALLVALFYLVPIFDSVVIVALLGKLFRRRFSIEDAPLTFLVALSALFYCQALARSDVHHLLITLAPFFVVVAWTAAEVARSAGASVAGKALVTRAAGAAFLVGAALFLLRVQPVMLRRVDQMEQAIALPRAGVSASPAFAQLFEDAVGRIREHSAPGDAILSLPYDAMFYFLSERRNATTWDYLWPGPQNTADQRSIVEQATAHPPAVVVIDRESAMEPYGAIVLAYVRARFRLREEIGSVRIYVPL